VSRMFKSASKKAGLENLRFHDLRHTFAQRLISRGESLYKVSKILGHSSVVVTEQHYGHLGMMDLKTAVDKIDGVVSDGGCSEIAVDDRSEASRMVKLH
jgi:integrase/recombinase XerD